MQALSALDAGVQAAALGAAQDALDEALPTFFLAWRPTWFVARPAIQGDTPRRLSVWHAVEQRGADHRRAVGTAPFLPVQIELSLPLGQDRLVGRDDGGLRCIEQRPPPIQSLPWRVTASFK